MRVRRISLVLVAVAVLSGATAGAVPAPAGPGDAVVVAVIDQQLSPYHWDFLASRTPQARDTDPGNDLPLDAPPHTWLPGFGDPGRFASYQPVDLTLEETDPERNVTLLQNSDAAAWSGVRPSTRSSIRYHWIPGTKVVGMVDFAGQRVKGSNDAHGTHVASVSTGNINGTCPECLLVFLSFVEQDQAEAALEWALSQPWIDLVVNSYGFSSTGRFRDRIYSGSDTEAQRVASERGQTIFFSAGNGLENDFRMPNATYFSSQEGPDWTVTVGAVAPTGHNYSGSGKPADIAAPGSGYPASGGQGVGGSGTFGGTSNATPVVGGVYAAALSSARQLLPGPSRVQADGVVASGAPVACGAARPDCELGDGALTARELRTRLFSAAQRTAEGLQMGEDPTLRPPVEPAEADLMAEGYGTLFAKARPELWAAELGRVVDPMTGAAAAPVRPAGERDWFIVDSYCRQQIWGTWSGGDWRQGAALPAPDPAWPYRSATAAGCDGLLPMPEPR
jgi:hypothetical protein